MAGADNGNKYCEIAPTLFVSKIGKFVYAIGMFVKYSHLYAEICIL